MLLCISRSSPVVTRVRVAVEVDANPWRLGLSLKKWRAIAMISIGRQQWWTNKDGLRMILSARQFV